MNLDIVDPKKRNKGEKWACVFLYKRHLRVKTLHCRHSPLPSCNVGDNLLLQPETYPSLPTLTRGTGREVSEFCYQHWAGEGERIQRVSTNWRNKLIRGNTVTWHENLKCWLDFDRCPKNHWPRL